MWKSLIDFFENSSDHRKLALNDKVRNIKMQKHGTFPQYLSRLKQFRDELGGVGVHVVEDYLVRLSLLGIPKIWLGHQYLMNDREKVLNWECLWSDLVHEEIRQNTRDGTSSRGKDEEKFALVGKRKKGKGNKSQTKP